MRVALLLLWALASPVLADAGTDAGLPELPDASVGQGGADRDGQEQDDSAGRTPTRCRTSQDCERGFVCEGGTCLYVGYRKADRAGCLLGVPAALVAFVFATRRSSRENRRQL